MYNIWCGYPAELTSLLPGPGLAVDTENVPGFHLSTWKTLWNTSYPLFGSYPIDGPRTEDVSIIDIALSFTYILDFIIEFSFLFGCFFTLIHNSLIWFINRLSSVPMDCLVIHC